jgi:hypothetical protein
MTTLIIMELLLLILLLLLYKLPRFAFVFVALFLVTHANFVILLWAVKFAYKEIRMEFYYYYYYYY